jgi:hypothetical protein
MKKTFPSNARVRPVRKQPKKVEAISKLKETVERFSVGLAQDQSDTRALVSQLADVMTVIDDTLAAIRRAVVAKGLITDDDIDREVVAVAAMREAVAAQQRKERAEAQKQEAEIPANLPPELRELGLDIHRAIGEEESYAFQFGGGNRINLTDAR